MRTLISNGIVVTADETRHVDLLIDGEHIAEIGGRPGARVDRTIDASGRLVLPGGIDVHTHLDMPLGDICSSDDFETGTIAAALGGTTTVVDYATQAHGGSLGTALDAWMRRADGKAVIDYGFHMAITDLTDSVEAEMAAMVAAGVPSFKLYMAYPGSLMLDDGAIYRVLVRARDVGALVAVHAENGAVIDALVRRALAGGLTAPRYHAVTRPRALEVEAVRRAIALAAQAGAPIYLVHLSTSGSVDEVASARALGLRVFGETCPQYLFLSEELYDTPGFGAAAYVMSPPLRGRVDQERLWRGLADDDLQVVATDHCPFLMRGHKDRGHDDFSKIPNGAPGIECRMSLLYDGGVGAGRISVNRFVQVASTVPARLFGLYPRKGAIATGSDADLVLFDPEARQTISAATHHMRVDYNPYEGRTVTGVVDTVLVRGRVIVERGRFVGRAGDGVFLARRPQG